MKPEIVDLADVIEMLRLEWEIEGTLGVSNDPRAGVGDLDELTRGLPRRGLVAVAGGPGSGKTSLLIKMLERVVTAENRHALFLGHSSTRDRIVQQLDVCRREASKSGAGEDRVRRLATLVAGYEVLSDSPVIDGDVDNFVSRARTLSDHLGGLDLVVIDCISDLLAGVGVAPEVREDWEEESEDWDDEHEDDDDYTRVDDLCRRLHALSGEIDAPVVFSLPVARALCATDGSFDLNAVPEPIEDHATVVIGMHRWATFGDTVSDFATLTLLKNRRGPLGTAMVQLPPNDLTQLTLLAAADTVPQRRAVGHSGGAVFAFFVHDDSLKAGRL